MAVLELAAACLHQAVYKHHRQHQQQLPPGSPADAGGEGPQPLLLQLQVSMSQFKHQLAVWKKVSSACCWKSVLELRVGLLTPSS